jgi:hypothetical protein
MYASFLNQPVLITLTIFRVLLSIKGIGSAAALRICASMGILPKTPFQSLS